MSGRVLGPPELSLLSKGLHFCPSEHFDIFGTLLDINKFIRNLTLRKHYFTSDTDVQDCVESDVLHNDISDVFSFQEHCSMKDLTELAVEGGSTARLGDIVSEGLNRVRIGKHFDFYPINSRTAGMDRFQKSVERDLV